jgi:hypothetical protein
MVEKTHRNTAFKSYTTSSCVSVLSSSVLTEFLSGSSQNKGGVTAPSEFLTNFLPQLRNVEAANHSLQDLFLLRYLCDSKPIGAILTNHD